MQCLRRTAVRRATLPASAAGCASEVEYGTAYDPLTAFPTTAAIESDEEVNGLQHDARLEALDPGGILTKGTTEEFAAKGYDPAMLEGFPPQQP